MGTAILTRARNLVRTKTPGDWPTGRQVYQHFAAPLVCKITSLAGKGKICKKVFRYTFSLFGLVQFAGPDRPCALRKIICRNTPTCVGKTKLGLHIFSTMRKHPHVRGEDGVPAAERPSRSETPPRAWGRPADGTTQVAASRNTPTCVGKTVIERFREPFPWKHPHVRGEDDPAPNHAFFKKETPPRAWGSPYRLARGTGTWGNTPTCVGKTQADSRRSQSVRKHPHVRGEDLPS